MPVFLRSSAETAAISARRPFEPKLVEASKGQSRSCLDLKAIYTALGDGTMRTKGTIDQIAVRHCSD